MAYLFRNNVLGKFGINDPQKVEDTLYKNNNKFILVILEKKNHLKARTFQGQHETLPFERAFLLRNDQHLKEKFLNVLHP